MNGLEGMTDEELTELRDAVRTEQNRRYRVENVPRQVEAMIGQALDSGVSRDRLTAAIDAALNAADGGEHADEDRASTDKRYFSTY